MTGSMCGNCGHAEELHLYIVGCASPVRRVIQEAPKFCLCKRFVEV